MTRMSITAMLEQARGRIVRLSAANAYRAIVRGATLIDVRTTDQILSDGHIPGALEVSLNVLEWRLDPASSTRSRKAPDLDAQVLVMCNQGFCSSLAAARLQALGFARATDVIGGFQAWRAEGLPALHRPAALAYAGGTDYSRFS